MDSSRYRMAYFLCMAAQMTNGSNQELQTQIFGELFREGPWSDIQLVRDFGSVAAEYEAIRHGVGMMLEPLRQAIQVTGGDRLDFLHRMVTGELKSLKPGQGKRSLLLSRNGRIEADNRACCDPACYFRANNDHALGGLAYRQCLGFHSRGGCLVFNLECRTSVR